jgi:hypothetical protein
MLKIAILHEKILPYTERHIQTNNIATYYLQSTNVSRGGGGRVYVNSGLLLLD